MEDGWWEKQMPRITLVVDMDETGGLTAREPVVEGAERPLIGGFNVQFTAGEDGALSAVAEGAVRELQAGDVVGEEVTNDLTTDDSTQQGDRD